jgi:hypothetical protein
MSQDTRGKRKAEGRAAVSAPSLLAEDSGAVLMWTIFIALPVFFALGALVVDAHRTYNTFDEAQNFADHTALAAAMELNGQSGAIDRAIQAACGPGPENRPLVTGFHTYGSSARALAAERLVFLPGLGPDPMAPNQYVTANDPTPICEATCAAPQACQGLSDTLNGQARFVSVTTASINVSWLLAPVMNAFGVNLGDSAAVAARATAGMTKEVCKTPPLFICNPLEGSVPSASFNDNYQQYVGKQFKATEPAGNTKIAGNYGLLKVAGVGKSEYANAVANPSWIKQCSTYSVEVETEPGMGTGKVEEGFNVHFDIYQGSMKNEKNNPDYAPARHVTNWLFEPGKCNKRLKAEDTDPILRDSCFSSAPGSACLFPDTAFAGRMGTGDWNCENYWTTMYNNVAKKPANCTSNPAASGYTRFNLYEDEIKNKNGEPACNKNLPPDGELRPREFVIAVVDCDKEMKGGRTKVSVREYIRVFMTEPIGKPKGNDNNKNEDEDELEYEEGKKDLYMEYRMPADPSTLSDVFKEYPVLYR